MKTSIETYLLSTLAREGGYDNSLDIDYQALHLNQQFFASVF